MICNKCGNNISDTSKFCGYCGNKVETVANPSVENNVVQNSVQPDLEQKLSHNTVDASIEQNQLDQLNNDNIISETVIVPPVNLNDPNVNEPKKKSYTWLFIVGGILLGIIAIVLLILVFSKTANSSVRELEKALNMISEKGETSGTIDTKILIETDTSDTYNLSATVKYAKNYDNYDMALTLNKSLLYEEMNLYSTITDETMTLYVKSSLIDMLGLTSSTADMWIYYNLTQTEETTDIDEVDVDDIDLSSVLDKDHYKFIDQESGIKHYQLIIDNDLLNKIKTLAPTNEELNEFEQSLSDINNGQTELTEIYYVDIYINNSGELVKVSMDLTDQMEDETVNKVIISFEFSNFGNTLVEIPIDAKNSTLDLEKYMSAFALLEDSTEDYGTDYEYNFDNYDDYLNGNYYNTNYYYGM